MRRFNDPWRFLERQLLSIFLGLILLVVMYFIKIEFIRKAARIIMVVSMVMLALVFVPYIGVKLGRAYRWIKIFGFSFQPSELIKFTLPLYLADAICRKEKIRTKMVRGLLPLLIVSTATLTLIFLEPDFGTAVVILFIVLMIQPANAQGLEGYDVGITSSLGFVNGAFITNAPVGASIVVEIGRATCGEGG